MRNGFTHVRIFMNFCTKEIVDSSILICVGMIVVDSDYVLITGRQNFKELVSWDQQIFAGSGIEILITFWIRDQNFG